ncbi:sigma-70 family RNA polymerase sigma factor [Microbacterium paludicola]|uniref:Sigma-70 family RNA polymerase sigma factor n=1 Tax=Microbacterium paludicola TaxID=300019 RepID=A0A4Y9FWQ8_9MICO|nr:sigma-70 family RNA polymerase sigma factor [Microbacterium paludicola]MBF0816339.1 sigma-70 family RNA polymerase sigma factor [Microbacterium paludicola]TFU33002.1 sigma-70 family RNA polymerase sigma factor [Microbacterium paludicola]
MSGELTPALRDNAEALLCYLQRRLAPEDAADAVAEVMATAWRRERALPDDPEQARMWLFGIARNVLLHAQRGEVRRSNLADRLRSLVARSAPPADRGVEVRDALARLEPDLAELVRLVHWDGFSLAEAAVHLEVPASTARGRYQRAKQLLREALAPVA